MSNGAKVNGAPLASAARHRVLFIHAVGGLFVDGADSNITRLACVMPPHGLLMVATQLKAHGHLVKIVDCFATPISLGELVRTALAWDPHAVCFSCTTSNFLAACEIAAAIKSERPALPSVFGGVHPTSIWRRILETHPEVDFVVVGEGEQTLLALAESNFDPAAPVPGVASRAANMAACSSLRPPVSDLDDLPFPAYDLLEGFPQKYALPLFNYPRGPGTTLITSRGCPHACAYCDRSVFGSSFRRHSAQYLIEHLTLLRRKYGLRHVSIYDDNFLLGRDRLAAFLEALLASGLRMTFNCIGSPHLIDREMLPLLKRAGCWMINLGVESGDENVIKAFRTHCSLDRVREAVHDLKACGIRAKGLFMMGIPGETEASIDKTIRMAVETPFDDANCTKFTPFPGAPIYKDIRQYGEFDENWPSMNCLNFVFIPHGFTKDRLEARYREFYREFYGRPNMAWKYARMAWESPESWKRVFRNLPAFLSAKKILSASRQ